MIIFSLFLLDYLWNNLFVPKIALSLLGVFWQQKKT